MREGALERKTRETEISVKLNLDGTGEAKIDTGIGFFDHMLTSLSRFAYFELDLVAKG
ncbi:MAG: imidazoleglycerol-phosphate dehydratase, partial [Desulfitobacteriaceae bacterium]